ncbi:MAG: SixA phosphatase family protein [Burkholderiales bacterium]
MDLLLWRHAEAEQASPDETRRLTRKGEKQAALLAAWLKPRLSGELRVLVSPALRTQQTAQALTREFETVAELGIAAGAKSILRAVGWPDGAPTVIVVGHQPTLGETAALLMCGKELPWAIKKGALWWFRTREQEGTTLRAVINTDLL